MRVGPALVGSVLMHGAVVFALVQVVQRARSTTTTPAPIAVEIVPPTPPSEDLAVTLLPDDPVLVAPRAPRTSVVRASARIATAKSGDTATATPSAASPISSHEPGHHGLGMRGPDLRLPTATLDRIAESGGEPAPEPETSGRIESAPNGTAVIHDGVTTVAIERDGTAHFKDKRDFDIHLSPLFHTLMSYTAIRHGIGNMISDWYRDPYAATRVGPTQDLPNTALAVLDDQFGGDESTNPIAKLNSTDKNGKIEAPILGGNFDITSYLMRKFVGDPFASRKRKLLDTTLDERASRGGAFRTEQLDHSAEIMHANLERVWAATRDPEVRRISLFELWDECAEGEGPLGEAGQRARAEVIGWIRARMPAGGPDAYGADELARLAAHRASTQPFEPY